MQESKETILKTVRKNGLSFINLLDSEGKVSGMYGISSTPAKMLIDKEGNVVGAALGYKNWDQDEFIALIEMLME